MNHSGKIDNRDPRRGTRVEPARMLCEGRYVGVESRRVPYTDDDTRQNVKEREMIKYEIVSVFS